MKMNALLRAGRMDNVAQFRRGDCGQPIAVRTGTQADLVRERLRLIREQFDSCMYSALTNGGSKHIERQGIQRFRLVASNPLAGA